VPRDIDFIGHHRAVQSFVEQQVGVVGEVLPLGEGARLLLVARRLRLIVQVFADAAITALPIVANNPSIPRQVGFGTEVAEHVVATLDGAGQPLLHIGAVVAVEAVASMKPAEMFSRRKICSKVRMTEVVPAPEEP